MEDAKLAERAREGDTTAYERLVRMHQAVAFRAAYLVTGDAQEAEDATQEAFVKAYRALNRFRPGAAFRPWLLTIVANEARNRRRTEGEPHAAGDAGRIVRRHGRFAGGCRRSLGETGGVDIESGRVERG